MKLLWGRHMRFFKTTFAVLLLALVVVPAAFAIRFSDDSYFMPVGHVGQSYSKQFDGAGGCGPALPYQYTIIGGQLPPGLSLSFHGLISGTPTSAGSYSFWVNLSDENPPSASWCVPASAQRQFTITVDGGSSAPPPAPLKINQGSLNPATAVANASYSIQLTSSGGGSPSWAVASGLLPAGLTLSSHGLLSGTPTATGTFTFVVKVSDASRSDSQQYTLSVVAPLKATSVAPQRGEVSMPLQAQLGATGGKAAYTWGLASGSSLPAGLSLDGATGKITGTPTAFGSFTTTVTARDGLGLTDSTVVSFTIARKLALRARSFVLKAGRSYRRPLRAIGGAGQLTWKLTRGSLPAGFRFDRVSGELVGKGRRPGVAHLVVTVTDALGATARANVVLKLTR